MNSNYAAELKGYEQQTSTLYSKALIKRNYLYFKVTMFTVEIRCE